jgi:hypothetical protein
MPTYWMRLSAIAIAFMVAIAARDDVTWQSAVLSIGFGHYLLSIWYARGKLAALGADWGTAIATLAAVLAGGILYVARFPLFVYFAAHHVCNEVYINSTISDCLPIDRRRRFRAMALALHTLLYFTLLRGDVAELLVRRGVITSVIDFGMLTPYLSALLLLAYVGYFGMLLRLRDELGTRALLELSVFEIAGLALWAVSFATPIRFLDVVCYHFVFWWFFPAVRLAQKGPAAVLRYAASMSLLVIGTFLLSPAVIPDYPLRNSVYMQQFVLWSNIHITSSFFLSNAHPNWIRKWFMPRRSAHSDTPMAKRAVQSTPPLSATS